MDFRKKYSDKFNKTPSNGSRVFPCGRADRHDEASSRFSQFCELVKNGGSHRRGESDVSHCGRNVSQRSGTSSLAHDVLGEWCLFSSPTSDSVPAPILVATLDKAAEAWS